VHFAWSSVNSESVISGTFRAATFATVLVDVLGTRVQLRVGLSRFAASEQKLCGFCWPCILGGFVLLPYPVRVVNGRGKRPR
jgi:hypothetical protein